MIRFLYGDRLHCAPLLRDTMFRDRAAQFSGRLKWAVQVDEQGFERDEYDAMNPLYVIWQQADGRHGGSLRFLPTTGPVMVNDHFPDLTGGVAITSPHIWECTRFCIAPDAPSRRIAARLLLGAAALGKRFHLRHAVGVFDPAMERIYRALGWEPVLQSRGRAGIHIGLWSFADIDTATLQRRAALQGRSFLCWDDLGMAAPARECICA